MNNLKLIPFFFIVLSFSAPIFAARLATTPQVLPFEEFKASYSGNDAAGERSYADHHLFVATVETSHQKDSLDQLQLETPSLDFWNAVFVSRNVSIQAPPDLASRVEKTLKKLNMPYTVASTNLQSWIEHERIDNQPQNLFLIGSDPTRFSLNQYHTYDEISAYLDALSHKYSDVAQLHVIGSTYEGRPIKGLRIGVDEGKTKPVIWIDSGIHAREWIAPASSLYIIDKLVTGAKTDATVRALLDSYEFHIYPLVNPDGYAYTWTSDRMWRKNRVRFQGYSCQGVDPNRNFGYDFGGPGTSGDVCSSIYRGPEAFSEREAQAVRDGVQAVKDRIQMFFSVHSYSQMIMLPYGSGPRFQSKHYNDQLQVARAGQRAISSYSGVHYQVGTIQQLLSAAAGAAADWAHEQAGIKYAFAAELRDKGQFGFILPASQITPTGEEWYRAVTAMVNEMARKENGRPLWTGTNHGTVSRQPQHQPQWPQWPPVWG